MKKILLILGLIYTNTGSCNEREMIIDANLTISAFRCSIFNSYIGETKEAERLFNLGYESGKKFYNYVATHNMSKDALEKEIPFIYFMIAGPNIDFNLGQLFSTTADLAMKIISQDSNLDFVYDEESKKIKAQNLIRDNNCQLLK